MTVLYARRSPLLFFTQTGLFNQALLTKSRATSVRKSPPEKERFHFKAMLRHPSSSASCFYSFISLSFSSAGIKPRLVVVTQTTAAFLFHLLSFGILGLDCSGVSWVFHTPPPPRHASQVLLGGAQYVARPSGIYGLIPPVNSGCLLSLAGTPPEEELLIRDPNKPNCTLSSIWMSQLVLDSRPPC